jgi:hypothetical protein
MELDLRQEGIAGVVGFPLLVLGDGLLQLALMIVRPGDGVFHFGQQRRMGDLSSTPRKTSRALA